MSELLVDKNVGMNGSFEYTKSGLPVNWILYTPFTVPEGDFEIIVDTTEFKDGKQSLKFLVRKCSANGGWHSPGFCNEYPAKSGETYRITFWVKNDGCQFAIGIGGISAGAGDFHAIANSQETIESWQFYEYHYTVPQEMTRIRIETNILKPGSFWIDDIRIEKLE